MEHTVETYEIENQKLKNEIDDLKDRLVDVLMEVNYSKQNELIEFLRELYGNVKEELNSKTKSNTTKDEMLFSLKKFIEEFAKNNKIRL
jgi:predicted RNase H-like nuclease (RuvC/YqgF family)